jgi:prepilin-type N-terminal cleavage/methylation domain-containing protein
MNIKKTSGFTLIELMIVVAIIAFLTMISVPSVLKFLAKAKRTEAYANLSSLYVAQKAYWAEHGVYNKQLAGEGSLGWKPEGYVGGGKKERFNYTYGVAEGQEGQHHFTGKLETPAAKLEGTKIDDQSFTIGAVGDIDGDGAVDYLTINERNEIKIVTDDLV